MSDLGLTSDDIAAIAQTQITKYIDMATIALTVYDAMLSFPQELRCIWKNKLTAVTFIYVIIRYGNILDLGFQVFIIDSVEATSIPRAIIVISYVLDMLPFIGSAAFDCLRIWAICYQRWIPFAIVFLLSMFEPAVNIYDFTRPQVLSIIDSGPFTGCYSESIVPMYLYLPVITRSMAVAADIAVLVFTLFETGHLFKTSLAVQLKTGYTAVLVRNGSLQFIALLILNVISMILDVFAVAADSGPTSEFIYINQAISSILLSRFILDLRFVHLGKSDESSGNVGSSIHFVSAVAGNMGAALDGSWVSGRSSYHAAEETETIQYSENPLSVGLFDKDEDLMEAASRLDAEHTVVEENDDQALTATMIATGHIELQNMA